MVMCWTEVNMLSNSSSTLQQSTSISSSRSSSSEAAEERPLLLLAELYPALPCLLGFFRMGMCTGLAGGAGRFRLDDLVVIWGGWGAAAAVLLATRGGGEVTS